jgi:3-polyprenyl-4-hydroxybenzoate decarboxylase
MLSPLFPLVMPGVEDLWSYGETGYHALSAAKLKERYPREIMNSVFRILGEGQLSLTKFLLAVNGPVDVKDFSAVLIHVLERCDFSRDLYILGDLSMDTLDYSGPEVNKGSKGVLLGVGDKIRELPRTFQGSSHPDATELAVFLPGCLVIQGRPYKDKAFAERIAAWEGYKDWPLIVVVDSVKRAVASEAAFLWTCFTRFEPAADIYAAKTTMHRHRCCYEGPIVIDARMKPWYPEELFCDEATKALVTQRWQEYFPKTSPPVAMGSSDFGHLGA